VNLEGYKVVTAREMVRIEALSIQEGASSESYMLKAGQGIAKKIADFIKKHHLTKEVTLLVGKGNNGGDAFVAGTLLLQQGHHVDAYHLFPMQGSSHLCQKHRIRFEEMGGSVISPSTPSDITCKGVVVDGILGTGFQGHISDALAQVITHVNHSKRPVFSIDIPSGIDGNTGAVERLAIQATKTLFLGLPKVGFFLRDGYNYIGALSHIDFGMDVSYLQKSFSMGHMLNEKGLTHLLPPLVRNRHKYQAGYVLAVAGSPGMAGAPMLSALSALRAGAGILRLFYPGGMEGELVNAPREIIKVPYQNDDPGAIFSEMKRAKAMLIGPGLGKDKEQGAFLKSFIKKVTVPTVIDAEGLFHLKGMFATFTFPCILTPHRQEMLDLLGKEQFDDMVAECQRFACENDLTLILKGAPTFIFHKKRAPLIISRGDPGMATAGAGDVLTGIVAGLLSQSLSARNAAALGVYIHARGGEQMAKKTTSYGLIASDLIAALPEVFKELTATRTLCSSLGTKSH